MGDTDQECKELGCEQAVSCRGFCERHYQQDYRRRNAERLRAYDRARAQDPTYRKERRKARGRWRELNPELAAYCSRLSVLRRKYGIGEETFFRMLDEQDGRCAICREAELPGISTHVDHCHKTGAVRGLLCENCNRALGIMKDNPVRLRAAAAYLEKSR